MLNILKLDKDNYDAWHINIQYPLNANIGLDLISKGVVSQVGNAPSEQNKFPAKVKMNQSTHFHMPSQTRRRDLHKLS